MSQKIGVLLSGCGVNDGSEIHEAVLTLLAIEKEGCEAVCFAPNINQTQVINHYTGKPENEKRNILVESARIARGNIKDIKDVNINELEAVILPGGFGAALNLSSFGMEGSKSTVQSDVEIFLKNFHKLKKPIGAICIAPNILANIFGELKPQITIGNDKETASTLETMGACHINKSVNEIVIDDKNLFVSTPAYMLGKSIKDIEEGINNLVKAIVQISIRKKTVV